MIYIDKQVTSPNGAIAAYHQVTNAELSTDGSAIIVIGSSWTSSAHKAEGMSAIGRWSVRIPTTEISQTLLTDMANYIVSTGELSGGSIIPPNTASLEDAKLAKRAEMKNARTAAINAPMVTPYGTFDSGPEDRTNITDAIALGQMLTAMEQPVSLDWTLADDSVVTLNMEALVTVGLLLGQKVQAAHARSRVVKQAIQDAETVEEVQAITWEEQE